MDASQCTSYNVSLNNMLLNDIPAFTTAFCIKKQGLKSLGPFTTVSIFLDWSQNNDVYTAFRLRTDTPLIAGAIYARRAS